ncbi:MULTISPECIES: glycosyltransferase family protein [Anaerolinea]|uniref:glycosyltransferase family protein n=1 Tax=Anaerolinea TaxID=233189 RepID=UPI00261D311C|nr:glycosyltransferase family protein [Anaerolinea thermophila]
MSNTVIIIQARMTSSRLPGKVLLDLGGQPALMWCVERCKQARSAQRVVVATTTNESDEPVVELCHQRGWEVFRGSEFDVLDRFVQAARWANADVVVRVTADCPLIDPAEVDRVVDAFFATGADFAANRLPPPWKRTTPVGLDTEVCRMTALERAWREATRKFEREHVMPYLYDEPGRFRVHIADWERDLSHHRWTLDTPEDYQFLREVVRRLDHRMDVRWQDVLALLEAEPELMQINAGVRHKSGLEHDARMK